MELLLEGLLRLEGTRPGGRSAASPSPPRCPPSGLPSRQSPPGAGIPVRNRLGRHDPARRSTSSGRATSARTGSSTPTPPRTSTARPAVVVDCGTATTLDAVDASGRLRRAARSRPACSSASRPWPHARLGCRGSSSGRPNGAIGRDTASAIQAGTVLGHRALIERPPRPDAARARGARSGIAPHDVRAVLTGGLAAAPWARAIEGLDAIDPDLTLKGLVLFHRAVAGGEEAMP